MYPWFAFGHITPYLHLSNKLAQKGHKISFFIPSKTQSKIDHLNHFPDLINFYPINVPHVDGLPSGAETTHDVPSSLIPLVMTAMDKTQNDIEILLRHLKPDLVFFDFVYWIPKLARGLGIKSLFYCIVSPITVGYNVSPSRHLNLKGREFSELDLMQPPDGFPDSSSIRLHLHEGRDFFKRRKATKCDGKVIIPFYDRLFTSMSECDALGFKTYREIEGEFVDYLESQFKKPVLLAGPVVPVPSTLSTLEEKWANWLAGFEPSSVIYCAFGSEATLSKDQFQQLLMGLELSGLPFLAALKPPYGAKSIREALPDGFEERVGGRGVVYGGWIQQPLILEHPSVGCFVTHCGSGSLSEALVNKCQLVMIPYEGDQIFGARLMGNKLKVGVEVGKGEEDGLFTKESVSKAIRTIMEEGNEIGRQVRANRANLRDLLLRKDLQSSYIDDFNRKLQALLD